MDWIGDTMADRPLTQMRYRLIAQVGNAVADCFEIAPSDRVENELEMVALLLPRHLPILVSVHDDPADACFLVLQYDITGARLHGILAHVDAAGYNSLADAILASGRAFGQLKEQFKQRRAECRLHHRAHELPEERWLRHQLTPSLTPPASFAAVHEGGGSSGIAC